jgi:uncharacterized protein (DUF1330 family)
MNYLKPEIPKKPGASGYLIADVVDIHDEALYSDYRAGVSPGLNDAGGAYLVRGGLVRVLEGTWAPTRIVVARFPSVDEAVRWWGSPGYEPLKRMRQKATRSNIVCIEGSTEEAG